MPGGGGGKGGISFPDPWDFTVTSSSQLFSDSKVTADARLTSSSRLDTTALLRGDAANPVTLKLEPVELTTTLKGDPNAPIATTFELLNLPRLSFEQWLLLIKTILTPKVRVHYPVNLNFAVSVFPLNVLGYDALTFSVCGEQQIITEEFVPNRFERCDVDCEPIECEPIDCKPIDLAE
jgi:hypothetical protein